jgi:hypothetical protein
MIRDDDDFDGDLDDDDNDLDVALRRLELCRQEIVSLRQRVAKLENGNGQRGSSRARLSPHDPDRVYLMRSGRGIKQRKNTS